MNLYEELLKIGFCNSKNIYGNYYSNKYYLKINYFPTYIEYGKIYSYKLFEIIPEKTEIEDCTIFDFSSLRYDEFILKEITDIHYNNYDELLIKLKTELRKEKINKLLI